MTDPSGIGIRRRRFRLYEDEASLLAAYRAAKRPGMSVLTMFFPVSTAMLDELGGSMARTKIEVDILDATMEQMADSVQELLAR